MKRRYKVTINTVVRDFVIEAENEAEAQEKGQRLFDAEIDAHGGKPNMSFSHSISLGIEEMWVCDRCGEDWGRPKFMTIRAQKDGSQRWLCLTCADEEDKAH